MHHYCRENLSLFFSSLCEGWYENGEALNSTLNNYSASPLDVTNGDIKLFSTQQPQLN